MTYPEYRLGKAPANKGKKYPPEPLTDAEVFALLDACSPRSATGLRHRALIVVLWRCGLRIAEALALYPKDIDVAGRTIHVLHGKGDKHRLLGLDPETMAVIARWLDRRERLGATGHNPVFCCLTRGKIGQPVRAAQARDSLKALARRAGVHKRVHPHGLRHTWAFTMAMEGESPLHIQQGLGHADFATTWRYLNHLAPIATVRAMQERPWPVNGHDVAPPEAIEAAS